MKKLLVLALVVFGLAACQTEPQFDVQMGGEQEVMLTVSLPDVTRASSADGFDLSTLTTSNYTLRYILEVYRVVNANTNELTTTCQRFVKTSDDLTMVFPVRLAPGYQYQVVAWADIVEDNSEADRYYDTDSENGLKAISIIENDTIKWNAMDETRDAYTATQTISTDNLVNGVELKLKRPFAKLRVVATDITDIRKVGLEPTKATVVYSQDTPLCRTFNAVTGKASAAAAKSHDNISYPDPATPVYNDATGELTLFADYFFVPTNGGTVKFSLDVYADDAKQMLIKNNAFNTEIFVERNKLTTIKGDVLTVGGNVEVKVENDLGIKEEISYVDTIESLQDKINNAPDGTSTKIVLGGNVAIEATTRAESQYGLVIPAGKVIVLDLNGHTISQSKECTDSYSMILNNGELTITGNGEGKIEFTNTAEGGGSAWGTYTIENRGEGVLTINNVTIRHNGCVNGETNRDTNIAIQNYQGKVVINGGIIASTQFRSLRDFTAGGEIIINGGTFLGQVWMQGLGNGPSSLTINGGNFSPVVGYDGSSVYITNSSNIVNVAVNGGMFNTKIGCYDATKEGAKGCIVAGEFTAAAKEATSEDLLANGYAFVDGENGNWTVESKGYYTDANGNYHITGANGWLWMVDQNDTYFGNKTIYLDNDIDFSGVDIRVTRIWKGEYSATFDGQGHTVSNIWMASNYSSNNQALFDGLMSVKNLTVTDAHVYGMSQVGIIGANIFGTIENCHVKNSRSYGYVHHVGGIVGLHSWGEIKNCSVENTRIECYYYGAVGAIAGCMNEMSRNITNCSIKNCHLIKEGPEGVYPDWDPLFGIVVGYADAVGDYVFSCDIENTTIKGVVSTQAYGEVPAGSTVNGAAIAN